MNDSTEIVKRKVFADNTENLVDYLKNIIHEMEKYIEQFEQYIPSVLNKDPELKTRSKKDMDLLCFLAAEGEEILRNKVTKSLFSLMDYVKKKHHYVMEQLKRDEPHSFAMALNMINSTQEDILALMTDPFILTEESISWAYDFHNFYENRINELGGVMLEPDYESICDVDFLQVKINWLFSELERLITYAYELATVSESSARSCLIIKKVVDILIKCYVSISSIYYTEQSV